MTVQEISVQDLAALGSSARIIDVREPDEWAQGHIAHASLVPLATVPGSLDQFDGDPPYIVCRSGGRSGRGCELLGDQGHHVVNVAGGMRPRTAAGFDIAPGGTIG